MFYEIYKIKANGKLQHIFSFDTFAEAMRIAEKLSADNPDVRYRVTHYLWDLLPF